MDFKKFTSLTQLLKYYSDETVCRAYLVKQRWDDGKPKCPYCGCDKVYNIEGGKRYKCANNTCYKKFSVTVGTIFESSNIPLNLWFAALYLASSHKKGISSLQLGKDIGVSQKTAWFMLHRIREAFKELSPEALGGEGVIVEADTTVVGGKVKNMTNSKRKAIAMGEKPMHENKTHVAGYVERGGHIRMKVLRPNVIESSLLTNNVSADSCLMTDNANTYKFAGKGYKFHGIVDHRFNEYGREGYISTNSIEGAFSLFDRMVIGIYHYISRKHMQSYCNEFAFRYNHRNIKDNERFVLSLQQVSGRLRYKDLIRPKKAL